jgi:hypothetical protein
MKSVSCISQKINGFEGQFKSLNNGEMLNLRGGKNGDETPPSDGDGDLILPFGKKSKPSKKNTRANQVPRL